MTWITIAVGDTETTGLSQEQGHRIIEVAFSCWAYNPVTKERRKIGKTWLQRIHPERLIDPHAEAVHKISLANLRGKPKWPAVAPVVSKLLSKVDILVCHNIKFDAPFIALELLRVGLPCPQMMTYCTMENGRKATGMGKIPNLRELAYACGIEYKPELAHSASYDTEVLEQCYWVGVDRGLFMPPDQILDLPFSS